MLDWFGRFAEAVFSLGYPGVVVALIIEGLGLPFPGDAVMAFYGVAAAKGVLNFWGILLAGILGYMVGCSIAYTVSYKFGPRVLDTVMEWPLLNQRSVRHTTDLLLRFGPFLLVPGRFLPGVRSGSSYVAGVAQMDLRPFLTYTGISVILWCFAWVSVGYWFGEHLGTILHFASSSLAYFTGALLVILLAAWWWRFQRAR